MTIFSDTFSDTVEVGKRAQVEAFAFAGMLAEDANPSKVALDFHVQHSKAAHSIGRLAAEKLDTDSPDFIQVAGWLKHIGMWLRSLKSAAENLATAPDSVGDRLEAASKMGLIHSYAQTLRCVLDWMDKEDAA